MTNVNQVLESLFDDTNGTVALESNVDYDTDLIVMESIINLKMRNASYAIEAASSLETLKVYFSNEKKDAVKNINLAKTAIKSKEYDKAIKHLNEAKKNLIAIKSKLNDIDDDFASNVLDFIGHSVLQGFGHLILGIIRFCDSGRFRAFGTIIGEADFTEGLEKRIIKNQTKQECIAAIQFLIQSCDKTIISINKIKKGSK